MFFKAMKTIMGGANRLGESQVTMGMLAGSVWKGARAIASGRPFHAVEMNAMRGAIKSGKGSAIGRQGIQNRLGLMGEVMSGNASSSQMEAMAGFMGKGSLTGGNAALRTNWQTRRAVGYAGLGVAAYGGYKAFGSDDMSTNMGAAGGYFMGTRGFRGSGVRGIAGGVIGSAVMGALF